MEDRHQTRSTIIASQLPLDLWHDAIGDPTFADAICDRIVHNAHKIILTGESMRKTHLGLTEVEHSFRLRAAGDGRAGTVRTKTERLFEVGGMGRPGEARVLKCKDIDIDSESITIHATFSKDDYMPRRKGKKAKPLIIPIHPEALDYLKARKSEAIGEAWVFPNPTA